MLAILRTNDFEEDFVIVDVIKNPISDTNSLAEVRIDNERCYTGGILCEITDQTINILKKLTPKEQWEWLLSIKCPNLYV